MSTNGDHGSRIDRIPGLMGLSMASQQIAAFERKASTISARSPSSCFLADAVQQVLQNMCCFGEIGETERPGATLIECAARKMALSCSDPDSRHRGRAAAIPSLPDVPPTSKNTW